MNNEERIYELYTFMHTKLKNVVSKVYVKNYLLNLKKDRNIRHVNLYSKIKYESLQ